MTIGNNFVIFLTLFSSSLRRRTNALFCASGELKPQAKKHPVELKPLVKANKHFVVFKTAIKYLQVWLVLI